MSHFCSTLSFRSLLKKDDGGGGGEVGGESSDTFASSEDSSSVYSSTFQHAILLSVECPFAYPPVV